MDEASAVLMTRMLFIDALIGVGLDHLPEEVADAAVKEGLAEFAGVLDCHDYKWNKRILETLPTEELQDLYIRVKLHEVTHAD